VGSLPGTHGFFTGNKRKAVGWKTPRPFLVALRELSHLGVLMVIGQLLEGLTGSIGVLESWSIGKKLNLRIPVYQGWFSASFHYSVTPTLRIGLRKTIPFEG